MNSNYLLHADLSGPLGDNTYPPILLLHGFTGSIDTMRNLGQTLADKRRTVSMDLPGHGKTGAPQDVRYFGFEHTIDAVVHTLTQLHFDRVHIVGYSMGGRIGLGLAIRHPSVVASLALIGASAGLSNPVERAARRRADDQLAADLLENGMEWFVDHWMSSPLFASQRRLGPDTLSKARSQRLSNNPEGLAGSLRGAGSGAQPSYWHKLAEVTSPTLLLVGDEDPKFRSVALRMGAALPYSKMVVVPTAGHAAHLENPDRLSFIIREFLDEVER